MAPQAGKTPEGSHPAHFWEGALRSREACLPLLLEPAKQICAPPPAPGPAPPGSASHYPEPPKRVEGLKPPQVSGLAWEPFLAKSNSLITQS